MLRTAPSPEHRPTLGGTPDRVPARRLGLLAVAVACGTAFGIQLWLGLWQQAHYATAAYDLGLFSQEVSAWGHLHLPSSTLDVAARHDALGEHFSPILALLGPLWRVFPSPLTLLAAQAALLSASVPAVLRVARRHLGWAGSAGITVAYIFSWELLSMGEYQFHELAFAVPLIAWALERADAGRWCQATALMAALGLVKEDMLLVSATFALLLLLAGRRRMAAGLAAGSLTAFGVLVAVVMPALAGGGAAGYWAGSYGELAPTPAALPAALVHHPMRLIDGLRAGATTKLATVRGCVLSFAGLSCFSPIAVLAVPILLSRFLTSTPNRWGMAFQYNAALAPILAMAAIDTLRRLGVRYRPDGRLPFRPGTVAGVALLVAPFVAGPDRPQQVLAARAHLAPTAAEASCDQVVRVAIRTIPAGAQVEATTWLTPRLVSRLAGLYLPDQDPRPPSYLVVQSGPWDASLPPDALGPWIAHRTPTGYQVLSAAGSCQLIRVNPAEPTR